MAFFRTNLIRGQRAFKSSAGYISESQTPRRPQNHHGFEVKTSPTKRSLDLLRADNWTVQVTERWNPFARVRQDLLGFIDLIAISPTRGIVGVQTTTSDNLAARIDKIKAEPKAAIWLASGGRIICHGWSKKGAKGKRKLWDCRIVEIQKAELNPKET